MAMIPPGVTVRDILLVLLAGAFEMGGVSGETKVTASVIISSRDCVRCGRKIDCLLNFERGLHTKLY